MAKGMYIGVGGVAKKVKNACICVGGIARKIKKMYIGVGGVARLFYSGADEYIPDYILASSVADGIFEEQVVSNASAVDNHTASQVRQVRRNIQASTTDLTDGTSTLATGHIYIVYE